MSHYFATQPATSLTCPWCKKVPPLYGIPNGWLPDEPVLCSQCGRWSIIPKMWARTSGDPLRRATAEERAKIRKNDKAREVRAEWHQKHPLVYRGAGS